MAYEIEVMVNNLQFSAQSLLGNILQGIVAVCIFVVIMLIGLYVAKLFGKAFKMLMQKVKVEKELEAHGIHDALLGFTFTGVAETLVKLYVVVLFLGIAAGIVQVPMIVMFAAQAANYLPSLVQGLIILIVGLWAGDYLTDRIKEHKNMPFANTVGNVIELFIAYNALVIAMPMLLPAADPSLLAWSFLVLLSAFALALGLGGAIAIGLGTKDAVADVVKKHKNKINNLL